MKTFHCLHGTKQSKLYTQHITCDVCLWQCTCIRFSDSYKQRNYKNN